MAKRTGTGTAAPKPRATLRVERVQTGVRIERRLLKVMKAVADYHDISLGDLIEGVMLHAFEGKPAFGDESLHRIAQLKRVFRVDFGAEMAHRLAEEDGNG
jgi:hypothetical protein